MIISKEYERLYLQKDDAQGISIDLPAPLPQHQLDGIRFLHKQYKKKAPGVILNDPSGCGKCMQVTLFISALKPVLKKPVLILSDSVINWQEHFENWTECGNEIIIGNSNPFTKNLIKINPVKDGFTFSRRSWGIVVLHDEDNRQDLLPLRFDADFKIWVTRDDLKENLNTLASIYEWLHPNQKFNVTDFTAKAHNNRDVIEKAVLLDAFVEDFLLRRTDVDILFKKPEYHKRPKENSSPVKGRTRKNKDPTGTKVKRSRINMIEDDEDETDFNESTIKNNHEVISNDNSMDTSESFIRDDGLNTSELSFTFHDSNVNKTRKNKDPSGTKIKRSKICEDDKEHKVTNDDCRISDRLNSTNNSIITSSNKLPISEENNDAKELDKNNVLDNFVSDKQTLICESSPDSSSKITDHIIATKSNEEEEDSSLISRYSQSETLNERQNCNPNPEKDNVIFPETEHNETHSISQANNVTTKHDPEEKETGVFIPESEYTDNCHDKSIKKEKFSLNEDKYISFISNRNDLVDNELDKTNTNNVDDFDAKLAEIEAKALKKLKGSILDSFF